jgi:hypothetical protein
MLDPRIEAMAEAGYEANRALFARGAIRPWSECLIKDHWRKIAKAMLEACDGQEPPATGEAQS